MRLRVRSFTSGYLKWVFLTLGVYTKDYLFMVIEYNFPVLESDILCETGG